MKQNKYVRIFLLRVYLFTAAATYCTALLGKSSKARNATDRLSMDLKGNYKKNCKFRYYKKYAVFVLED